MARDPKQAIPLQGSYAGRAEDFVDMQVQVRVTRVGPAAATQEEPRPR